VLVSHGAPNGSFVHTPNVQTMLKHSKWSVQGSPGPNLQTPLSSRVLQS